jgi:hypothetical protein
VRANGTRGGTVRLAIQAPPQIKITRRELLYRPASRRRPGRLGSRARRTTRPPPAAAVSPQRTSAPRARAPKAGVGHGRALGAHGHLSGCDAVRFSIYAVGGPDEPAPHFRRDAGAPLSTGLPPAEAAAYVVDRLAWNGRHARLLTLDEVEAELIGFGEDA